MRIACLIQARMGSTRLPGKMLMDLGGKPVLWHTIMRAKQIGIPVIVSMPEKDTELSRVTDNCQVGVNYGPEDDVLARYYFAAAGNALEAVMRICGDQPLLDPTACTRVLMAFKGMDLDWCSNDYHLTYPIGLGCECFTFQALEQAHQEAKMEYDREHVISWIHRQFSHKNLTCPINGISDLRLTIDTQEDLDFVRRVDAAGPKDYSLKSTLEAVARAKANHLAPGAQH